MQLHKPSHIHHPYKVIGWVICILAAIFYCYEYLLRIEPSVMTHELMGAFNITAAGLGMLSATYYYAYTPLQAVVGIVIDYFGPRRVLIVALALCTIGSFVFSMTHNLYIAALGRFLIGIGSAFAFVGVLKLGSIWLPKEKFATFTGFTTSLGMIGAMVGDVTMSLAIRSFGWHAVIIAGTAIGVILFPLFLIFVREHHPKNRRHAISAYLPMQELMRALGRIIKKPQMWYCGLIGCMLYLALTVFAEMWGIAFIQSMGHFSAALAAKINASVFLGFLIGSPISGWLSNKWQSRRKMLITGSILTATTFTLFLLLPMTNPWILGMMLFLVGFFSSAEILCFVVAHESVRFKTSATAISFANFLIMLGGMIIQPLVGKLLDLHWSGEMVNHLHLYSTHNFRVALLIVPILMFIAAGLSFLLKETYQRVAYRSM